MKLLDGRELAGFIQERHAREVAALGAAPRLAIVRTGDDEATDRYLRAKQRYGVDIGVVVEVVQATSRTLLDEIVAAGERSTGVIVQLPLAAPELTDDAIAAVPPARDVDGLGLASPYEATTPKAILWLLAGYNIDLSGRIAVVGQGRLVGRPLADALEASGRQVVRCDVNTPDLAAALREADVVVTATGQAGLITAGMLRDGAVIIDAGSPVSELAADVLERADLVRTPNPGGVGPMTVAALFDNVLIASRAT